ncbi:Ibr finger domain protein [Lasiodiplodia theobromae]|uniref:Ibr finger domain protein n=1 Tax=Lasiodiplodia theobromae TaxID=45133 RepID=UPI0015C2DFE8|nr:Ibr finger domain protein [Lasiodiplodia theobromae]KAF4537574.1 Ibr finger domain protein [Lasiodiplodia theobromae]
MAAARTQANNSNCLLRDVQQTNWSWDTWDLQEDARSKGKEHGSSSAGHDENVDDDEDLAWRLQLEALQEVPGWGDGDGDAEFAMMQQVAEIEEAEKMRKKAAGLQGGGDDDEELALLMALEGVGGWWMDQHEEGVGMSSSASKEADRRSNATTLCATTTSTGTAQLAKDPTTKGSSAGSSKSQRIPAPLPVTKRSTAVCAVCNEPPLSSSTSSSSPKDGKGLAVLPCGHAYCAACLNNLFRAAVNDLSLFPPRCCGVHIPLDGKDDEGGKEKSDKGGARNKVGASKSSAGAGYRPWLETETVAALERRLKSAKETIVEKTAAVEQSAATAAAAATSPEVDEEFLRMAEACGWAKCYGCGRFVELEFGCNHMVCCCGAHFCYACGKPWKTCNCAQWDEDRLLRRAADLVVPAAGRPNEEAAPVAAHNTTPNQPRPTPQNTEPLQPNRRDEASTRQQQRQQRQRQRRTQSAQHPVPPRAPTPPPPPNRNPVIPPHAPPSYPLPVPPNHHHHHHHHQHYNAVGNNNNNADDENDPPPPYPGPPLATSLLDSSFHHNPYFGDDPRPQRPLTRTEYARLRASVRTVVDALNGVLAGMDEEGTAAGGGAGVYGERRSCGGHWAL